MSDRFNDELEDAVFRLMMEKVAYAEGEKLIELNEKLKSDPSADVPKDVQDRCLKRIRKEVKRRDRQRTGTSNWKVLRYIPIAVVTALFLGLIAYAAFPLLRTSVQNLILEKNPDSISWKLSNPGSSEELDIPSPSFSISLPSEYQMISYSKDNLYEYVTYKSVADPKSIIHLNITYDTADYFVADTEAADYYEEVTIHGYDAFLVVKNKTVHITWSEVTVPCFVSLYVSGNSVEQAKAIAESFAIHS